MWGYIFFIQGREKGSPTEKTLKKNICIQEQPKKNCGCIETRKKNDICNISLIPQTACCWEIKNDLLRSFP